MKKHAKILSALLLACLGFVQFVQGEPLNHNPWVTLEDMKNKGNIGGYVKADAGVADSSAEIGETLYVQLPEPTGEHGIHVEGVDINVKIHVTVSGSELSPDDHVRVTYGEQELEADGVITISPFDLEMDKSVYLKVKGLNEDDDVKKTYPDITITFNCDGTAPSTDNSMRYTFPVGSGTNPGIDGILRLSASKPTPDAYFAYYLNGRVPEDYFEVLYNPDVSEGGFLNFEFSEEKNAHIDSVSDFSVQTPSLTGGSYAVWARAYTEDTEQNSFWLEVNGVEDRACFIPTQEEWIWVKVGEGMDLPAGSSTLKVKLRDAGVVFDRFLVTDDLGYAPQAMDDLPTSGEYASLEAEDGSATAGVSAVAEEGLFAGSLVYAYPSLNAGTYDMWLRVKNSANATLSLYWDGQTTGESVTLPESLTWTWVKVDEYVSLSQAGPHELELVPGLGVDVDVVLLSSDETLQPSGVTPVAPGDPQVNYWSEAESPNSSSFVTAVTGEDGNQVSNGGFVYKHQVLSNLEAVRFDTAFPSNDIVESDRVLTAAIPFLESGPHAIWARIRTPFSDRDSVWVSFLEDGQSMGDIDWDLGSHPDWTWVDLSHPEFDLAAAPAGTVRTLQLKLREGGVHLDKLIVTTDTGFAPVEAGDEPSAGSFVSKEAEDLFFSTGFSSHREIRQIKGSDTLVDIIQSGEANSPEYSITLYPVQASMPTTGAGLYDVTQLEDPYRAYTVENPDADAYDPASGVGNFNRVSITPAHGAEALFTYEEGDFEEWTLLWGGIRKEHRQKHFSADGIRTDLVTYSDAAGNVVAQKVEVKNTKLSGDKNIKEMKYAKIMEMDQYGQLKDKKTGEILTKEKGLKTSDINYCQVYSVDDGTYPGKVQDRIEDNGYWEIYRYDAKGRIEKEVQQYLDSEYGDKDNSRVLEYSYDVPAGLTASGPVDYREIVEKVRGVEVSRTFRVIVRDGSVVGHHAELWRITATEQGAAWNDSSNLVTKTFYIPDGQAFAGMVDRIEHADGTETHYTYTPQSTGYETIEETGVYNGSNFTDGIRTVTTTILPSGTVMSRTRTDIASGLTLDSMTVDVIDRFSRPTEISYGDGTGVTKTYAPLDCGCGSDKVLSETDRQGITTSYEYDALGRRTSKTRLGVTELYELDAEGRVVRTTREAGTETLVVSETDYDSTGRVVKRREPGPVTDGPLVETTWDYGSRSTSDGDKVMITYPDGGTEIRTTYPDGQLDRVTGSATTPYKMDYPDPASPSQTYLATRNVRLKQDPQNPGAYLETAEWTETREEMGRLVATVYPDGDDSTVYPQDTGTVATTDYDDNGRMGEQVDPDGVTTRFTYDALGRREQTAVVEDSGTAGISLTNDRVTEREVDVIQKMVDFGDGSQVYTFHRTRTYVYNDEAGPQTKVLVSTSEDEVYGRGSIQTNASGAETRSYRSTASNGDWTEKQVQASGAYTKTTVDDGLPVSVAQYAADDTLLHETTIAYDAFNRRETVTDSRTGTTSYAYYDNSQIKQITAPDPDGTGPLSSLVTAYEYDEMNRQVKVVKPDASEVHTEYDQRGQVVKTWGSETYPVEYDYDDQGRMRTLTTWKEFDSQNGAAETEWVYNAERGWLERKEYDDGNGTDYEYTPGGRLATRTWARTSAVTHYAYTPFGDLWAVNYVDSQNTPDILYNYFQSGNHKKVVDGQFGASPFGGNAFPGSAPALATERYTYEYGYRLDLLPETEKISGLMSFDGTLTRTYQTGSGSDSVVGRSSGYEWVANTATNTVTYAYDLAGRLEDVSDGVDTFNYGYHTTNGNLLASVSGPVHDVVYEYEPGRNAMKSVENTETVGTNTLVSRYAYTYNELGQRVDRTQSGGAVTNSVDSFEYDDLGQVTSSTNDVYTAQTAWNPSYSYDDIGNRAGTNTDLNGSQDYTANLLDQYTDIGTPAVQPSYDDDGNMTDDGTGWTFTWNGENRLIEATDGTTTLELEYDYQGRLIKKTENGLSEMYVYDGWNRIATYAGGTLQETNLWGLDLSGSLQGAGGVGGLLKEGGMYPLYDANGNIMQKLDSNGNALMSVTYDPFGNLIDGTLVGDYGFSTKMLIQGVNWYYYGFRYYDPETGRWPNRDPIAEQGGVNLYGFVGNDLIASVDVLGKCKLSYRKARDADAPGKYKSSVVFYRYPPNENITNDINKACENWCTSRGGLKKIKTKKKEIFYEALSTPIRKDVTQSCEETGLGAGFWIFGSTTKNTKYGEGDVYAIYRTELQMKECVCCDFFSRNKTYGEILKTEKSSEQFVLKKEIDSTRTGTDYSVSIPGPGGTSISP